jgi:hypothetical protein
MFYVREDPFGIGLIRGRAIEGWQYPLMGFPEFDDKERYAVIDTETGRGYNASFFVCISRIWVDIFTKRFPTTSSPCEATCSTAQRCICSGSAIRTRTRTCRSSES